MSDLTVSHFIPQPFVLCDGCSEELTLHISTCRGRLRLGLNRFQLTLSIEGAAALAPVLQSAAIQILLFGPAMMRGSRPVSPEKLAALANTQASILDILLGAVAQNESIRSLHIESLPIRASSLSSVLSHNTSLGDLTFHSCKLDHCDPDVEEGKLRPPALIAQTIGTLGRVEKIDLGGSHGLSPTILHLAAHHAQLKKLHVNLVNPLGFAPPMENETIQGLATLLSCTNSLETLELRYDHPTPETLEPVLQGLLHNTCTKNLRLQGGHRQCTPEVDQLLAEFLRANTSLTFFELMYWRTSVAPILRGVRDNLSITCLSLMFGNFEDAGVPSAIGDLLSHNHQIRVLDLNCSSCYSLPVCHNWSLELAQGLQRNSTLQKLTVGKMSTNGLVAILRALHTNTTLQELSVHYVEGLDSTDVLENIGTELPAVLQLKRLSLATANSIITAEGQRAFVDGVRHNHSLQHLSIKSFDAPAGQLLQETELRIIKFCLSRNRFRPLSSAPRSLLSHIFCVAFRSQDIGLSTAFWLLRDKVGLVSLNSE